METMLKIKAGIMRVLSIVIIFLFCLYDRYWYLPDRDPLFLQ